MTKHQLFSLMAAILEAGDRARKINARPDTEYYVGRAIDIWESVQDELDSMAKAEAAMRAAK